MKLATLRLPEATLNSSSFSTPLCSASPSAGALVARPSAMQLGASLYIPATRPDLAALLAGRKLGALRSMVVCTEDAVAERDLPAALDNLRRTLDGPLATPALTFLRPRNPKTLAAITHMNGVENTCGVVLPKLDESNLLRYVELLAEVPHWLVMPTIETDVAFSRTRLEQLCHLLEPIRDRVLCIRIGGNDLMQLLRLKRPKSLTLYDTPLRTVLGDLIVVFIPAGFSLSAPVFEHLDSWETLAREIELDIAYGLWTKTAIHPQQVTFIESRYRVSAPDAELAHCILAPDAPAVFNFAGQMVEPSTHRGWAERLLQRAQVFGLDGHENDAEAGLPMIGDAE